MNSKQSSCLLQPVETGHLQDRPVHCHHVTIELSDGVGGCSIHSWLYMAPWTV